MLQRCSWLEITFRFDKFHHLYKICNKRQQKRFGFDVLLTVHLSIFISVINQLDAQIFLFYNKFISCLYMFRAHVLIIRRSKLYYTASGIIKPIGGRPVHRLRGVHRTATYRFDDTWGCIIQFWPPDDEHMCSKHVEAWNKLMVKQKKNCASICLIACGAYGWGEGGV